VCPAARLGRHLTHSASACRLCTLHASSRTRSRGGLRLRVGYVGPVPSTHRRASLVEHAPHNAMGDPDEIERFYDRCSDLMRELLDGLAAAPDRPRPFPEIEDAIGWPRRRIASVLGGVARLRHGEFGGRRPYHFHDTRASASGSWELWMDRAQAKAVRAVQRS
jgi:hypothetical protein